MSLLQIRQSFPKINPSSRILGVAYAVYDTVEKYVLIYNTVYLIIYYMLEVTIIQNDIINLKSS